MRWSLLPYSEHKNHHHFHEGVCTVLICIPQFAKHVLLITLPFQGVGVSSPQPTSSPPKLSKLPPTTHSSQSQLVKMVLMRYGSVDMGTNLFPYLHTSIP